MRFGVLGVCAVALAVAHASPSRAMGSEPVPELTETKERLRLPDMEAYVAGPVGLARAGDMPGAARALDQLIEQRARRHGPDSIEVADTLTSFMIVLYNDDRRSEALAYAPRTLEAVRRAWGSDHLEYALLLNDVVQMDYELNHDAVGAQAEAALLEAYRIRVERLGPSHKETISTLIYLGRIQGLRSRTGGELARAMPAIRTLRRAISAIEATSPPQTSDNIWARNWLAEVYARNGALEPAMQAFDKAVEMARVQDALDRIRPEGLAAALAEGGLEAEAAAFLQPYLDQPADPPVLPSGG